MREIEKDRDTQREREREPERQKKRETERDKKRQRQRYREVGRERKQNERLKHAYIAIGCVFLVNVVEGRR